MRKGLLKLTDSLLSHSPSLKHPSVCPACGAGIGEQQQSCQLCQAHSLCAACGIRTGLWSNHSRTQCEAQLLSFGFGETRDVTEVMTLFPFGKGVTVTCEPRGEVFENWQKIRNAGAKKNLNF